MASDKAIDAGVEALKARGLYFWPCDIVAMNRGMVASILTAASAIDGDAQFNEGVEAAEKVLEEISAVFRVRNQTSYEEGYVDACDVAIMILRKLKKVTP